METTTEKPHLADATPVYQATSAQIPNPAPASQIVGVNFSYFNPFANPALWPFYFGIGVGVAFWIGKRAGKNANRFVGD